MASRVDDLLERIAGLEQEIDVELDSIRTKWRYRIEKGRVRFESDVHEAHLQLRRSILRYLRESQILSIVTAPVIYSLMIPIVLLDLWVSIYQSICFRAYGINRVRRSDYIVIDRRHLAYLNGI